MKSEAGGPSREIDPLVDVRVGPYRVQRLVGEGGMGRVYAAVDERIDKPVALKVLPPSRVADPAHQEHLLREALTLGPLQHPGLVQVFGIEHLPDGSPCLVMEYLQGQTLRQVLEAGPLPRRGALRIACQVADALTVAHARGVAHLDLKPENLMLVPDRGVPGGRRARVLDFGLARLPDQTGALRAGTPAYQAPETCLGDRPPDPAADVYGLGVVLYEMLRGSPPFTGDRDQVRSQHVFCAPPPLSARHPEDVIDLVAAMLEKSPARRPRMAEVAQRLRRALRQPGERTGPREQAPPTHTTVPGDADGPILPRRPAPRSWAGWALSALALGAVAGAAALYAWAVSDRGRMALIPAGSRTQGSSPQEVADALQFAKEAGCPDCSREIYERELPERKVYVSAFWLDRHEVTNEEVVAWLNRRPGLRVEDGRHVKDGEVLLLDLYHPDQPYRSPHFSGLRYDGQRIDVVRGMEHLPVVQITWHGARRYCADRGKRLPTEAEWEAVARGRDGRRFPWGDTLPGCNDATFGRTGACKGLARGPAPVGSALRDRTPQDVFDLGGNVREWVEDQFLHDAPPCTPSKDCFNPVVTSGPASAPRLIRGGSWYATMESLRLAGRTRRPPDDVAGDVGFRCARSLLSWPSLRRGGR
jgi:serine/threonine-protein kinase